MFESFGRLPLSPFHLYRKWEESTVKRVRTTGRRWASRVQERWGLFWRRGSQYYTILLIPDSEKQIVNFKVSVFALAVLATVLVSLLGALFFYSTQLNPATRRSDQVSTRLELAQINLEMVREEAAQLRIAAQDFEDLMVTALSEIGISKDLAPRSPATEEIASLRVFLSSYAPPLQQVGEALNSQKELLSEIPTLWPLKSVRGWITNPFGPTIHPFTGQWYLHKGVDIAQSIGTPIVATADGRVTKVDYEALGYGHYIDLKHNYGFLTKYGHLLRAYVRRGQDVVRGQVIGALGSSGLSTGPHLHYEVRIGNQVVDPTKYLSFSSRLLDD